MKVSFVGHRKIKETQKLQNSLYDTILSLINTGATTFLFGSRSEFDDLAWEIVTEIKKQYPFIQRVYVRSSFQYIDKPYE